MRTMISSLVWSSDSSGSLMISWDRPSLKCERWVEKWTSGTTSVCQSHCMVILAVALWKWSEELLDSLFLYEQTSARISRPYPERSACTSVWRSKERRPCLRTTFSTPAYMRYMLYLDIVHVLDASTQLTLTILTTLQY